MTWKRKAVGGTLAMAGFLLSPLSWWNDAFVNLPLAVGAAWLVAWFHPPLFQTAVVVAYWLTNVLGFILMHLGARQMRTPVQPPLSYGWRNLARDLCVSLAYTALLLVLLKLKVLQPPGHYLGHG